jgi:hypothetical protein
MGSCIAGLAAAESDAALALSGEVTTAVSTAVITSVDDR